MTEQGIHPTEKNILLSRDLALTQFLPVWKDSWLADSVAFRLTCTEADALADLLAANGYPAAANEWLRCHVETDHDDDDETHYLFETEDK